MRGIWIDSLFCRSLSISLMTFSSVAIFEFEKFVTKRFSFFFKFFIFLSYLIVPKNTSETHILQFFHKNSI